MIIEDLSGQRVWLSLGLAAFAVVGGATLQLLLDPLPQLALDYGLVLPLVPFLLVSDHAQIVVVEPCYCG